MRRKYEFRDGTKCAGGLYKKAVQIGTAKALTFIIGVQLPLE